MDPNSIAETLRQDIEAGALAPGAPLQQEEVARRFGVSRQPVRQAFDRLSAEGLLRRRSDRTLVVAGLTAEEAAEITGIRILLESEALRLAFPHIDERTLRTARRIAADLTEEDDPVRIEELDVAFHATLYKGCGNRRLHHMIESLRRESRRAYQTQPKGSVSRRQFADEHDALLRACEDKDLPGAMSILARHLSSRAID